MNFDTNYEVGSFVVALALKMLIAHSKLRFSGSSRRLGQRSLNSRICYPDDRKELFNAIFLTEILLKNDLDLEMVKSRHCLAKSCISSEEILILCKIT